MNLGADEELFSVCNGGIIFLQRGHNKHRGEGYSEQRRKENEIELKTVGGFEMLKVTEEESCKVKPLCNSRLNERFKEHLMFVIIVFVFTCYKTLKSHIKTSIHVKP